jgi:N-methylhydantoinase B
MQQKSATDLVTFEILRHRLWGMNDEMGLLAGRISGSPAVYESGDFNTAILTADGRGLFTGVYVIRQASALDVVVQAVIRDFEGQIRDGDVFMTNDPWAGALHAMDAAVVAPVYWQDELIAWTGIVMHEVDVGGPKAGSWTVGARSAYEEPALLPPVKIVDAGVLRQDIERAWLRNSRTPHINALNLRAKIASQVTTRARIHDIINEYGKETFVDVCGHILEYVKRAVRQRIAALPDGTYYANTLLDHDGTNDEIYTLRLAMRKSGEKLVFDFTGTDKQAGGPINCAWSGLVGGILQVLFPLLCFDLPWSHGAVWDCIEVISEPGTINNATYPAPTSMATVNASQATGDLVWEAMARIYGCSPRLHDEVIASGYAGLITAILSGKNRDGKSFVSLFTDPVGGGGARSFKDGIDTQGSAIAPSYAIPNVERIESLYPVLYAYRRELGDTAGPGKFRGGVGMELMILPYGTDEPLDAVFIGTGTSHPIPKGAHGGMPGCVQRNMVLRGTSVFQQFADGVIPTSLDQVTCERREVMPGKHFTQIKPGDAWLNFNSGGGGYGDPLLRDLQAVLDDVRSGACSMAEAHKHYGLALNAEGGVDREATRANQDGIRRDRLARASAPPGGRVSLGSDAASSLVGSVGEALDVRELDGRTYFACAQCEALLGTTEDDALLGSACLEQQLDELMPRNSFGRGDLVAVRTYVCPECGAALFSDVRMTDEDPYPPSMRFEPGALSPSVGADFASTRPGGTAGSA